LLHWLPQLPLPPLLPLLLHYDLRCMQQHLQRESQHWRPLQGSLLLLLLLPLGCQYLHMAMIVLAAAAA
jgi:hypothetical protein